MTRRSTAIRPTRTRASHPRPALRRVSHALLLCAGVLALPMAGGAQSTTDTTRIESAVAVPDRTPPVAALPTWAATVSLIPRPDAPLAGIALAIDGGASRDRPGREGEHWLWAQLLVRSVEEMATGAHLRSGEAEVRHDRVVVRFVVEPDDVTPTLVDLERALRLAPSTVAFEQVRARLLASFAFETDSPVLEMEQERRMLLDGRTSPWARPVRGTRVSIEGLGVAEIDAVGRALSADDLHLAVVGPVERERIPDALAGASFRTGTVDASGAPVRPSAPESFSGSMAWTIGDQLSITRSVTNTWISVAFPVPSDVPPTLLEFLAHRMREEIETQPPDPWLFDADLRIARRPEGRLLVVEVSILPEATEQWARRILEAPATASIPVQEDYFHWLRRRFRARVLLAEAAPEVLAARIAIDALSGVPGIRDVGSEAWGLSPERLSRAADALGPARILVYGPNLLPGG